MINILLFVAAFVLIAGCIYLINRSKQAPERGNNPFTQTTTKAPSSHQKCSRCKQMHKLTFYSNPQGTVLGLCKDCRKKLGDKAELDPL